VYATFIVLFQATPQFASRPSRNCWSDPLDDKLAQGISAAKALYRVKNLNPRELSLCIDVGRYPLAEVLLSDRGFPKQWAAAQRSDTRDGTDSEGT